MKEYEPNDGEEESDEDIDDFIHEDDLPMFEHEEFPPESDKEEDSDNVKDAKLGDLTVESSDESCEDGGYKNPYLERNKEIDREDILNLLSKSTQKDKNNKKKFKKEFGKYQFSIKSENNKALKTSNKKRYETYMKSTRFDKGFKEERNLDKDDDDFYENIISNVLGERVQVKSK